jgi:hypothetical protein
VAIADRTYVEALTARLLRELGEAGVRMARLGIRSATLRDALRFEQLSYKHGRLIVPHYWAIYQHDGRGPVLPRSKRYIVFFRDPNDDPRLAGGYPVRFKDVRRLTGDEFRRGLEENRRLFEANPAGGKQQFMVVRDDVGPTRPQASYPFFTKGMVRFPALVERMVAEFLRAEIKRLAVSDRSTATLRL